MKEKNACHTEDSRYQKAGRKKKAAILNEFIKTTGYNRKYALQDGFACIPSSPRLVA